MARRTQSSATSFKLDDYDLGQFSLMRPTHLGAKRVAIDLVKIDPWRTLQIDQLKLAASLICIGGSSMPKALLAAPLPSATPGFMAPTLPCWPSCPTAKDKESAQRCYAGWNGRSPAKPATYGSACHPSTRERGPSMPITALCNPGTSTTCSRLATPNCSFESD